VARLGELERAVMEVLWQAGAPRTARQVSEALPTRDLAKTTVLTVLSRLEAKGRVERCRDGWAHTYAATASREDYIAELMHEALGDAADRTAALVRFAGQVSPEEAAALRAALGEAQRRTGVAGRAAG
jgi:predicted transcriptional regulator